MFDESLVLALVAALLIFAVFYVLQPGKPGYFSAPSLTDKYAYIDQPEYFSTNNYTAKAAQISLRNNKSSNWTGLDESDRTGVMALVKNKFMLNQSPPASATYSRKLINQEYGRSF